ncbi:putative aminophospholipid-translocase [Massospora cicadina]|nr:putative aminophospholipid-translocase [Massospora cicadina]
MKRNFIRMKEHLIAADGYQPLDEATVLEYDIPMSDRTRSSDLTCGEAVTSSAPINSKLRTVDVFNIGGRGETFPPNLFRNQKYTLVSFLPVVLYEQFKYFFNLYFLLVAVSQFFPYTRIGYLVTYVGPLVFVLGVTVGKEAYDDYQRYKRDCVANSQTFTRINPPTDTEAEEGFGLFEEVIPSANIKVGDLIILNKDQRVPADMVLLWTSDASGACFIRTDQLDGETDWKLRVAVRSCQEVGFDGLKWLRGTTSVEIPHKDIYSFVGTLSIVSHGAANESLTVENVLWANTVLASGKAVGLVVYTGSETRAALNTFHPRTKVGLIDLEINRLAKILCLVTFGISLLLIALNGFHGNWYIYLVRFLILFSSIIPISLRVNLDFGKAAYSSFIQSDPQIPGTLVRTSTIPEELGRLEYLLTDKTGTLTQNDMAMKKIHLGTMSYGMDTMDEVARLFSQLDMDVVGRPEGEVRVGRPSIPVSRAHASSHPKSRRDITQRVHDMIEALGVCHNVTPALEEDGGTTYQASSPDEVAIVKFTASVGLSLVSRESQVITLRTSAGRELRYAILHTFPFDSVTKRMGIIVRDLSSSDCTFFLKGADSTVAPLVVASPWLEEECANMAREGLRTLVVARKRLTTDCLAAFEAEYTAAQLTLSNRANNLQRVISAHLEFDLELLGLTGVEDRLQDQVKSTLETLRNAGLKIWMLTGDKIETATCIAVSSKLVARNQPIHQMQLIRSGPAARAELDLVAMKKDCCLVIDGDSLQVCLTQLRETFVHLAVTLPTVVCCRCTPTQKADITRLIKDYTGRRVCAVGDGGNDVAMILAADVGVGIVGKEGKQASLAADFSIHQFSYLARLLVWHGRNSYKRSSKLSQFVIHRGLIISVMQAVFSAIFYYAPIALYQGLLLVGYSTLYTMGPVCSLVLDQDIDDNVAMTYPELYKDLTKGRSLSYKTFFWWLTISLYQGRRSSFF